MSAERICEELKGVSCALCGNSPQWEIHRSARARLNSVTAVVRCSNCGAFFFVKRLSGFEGAAPTAIAQEEFDSAQRIFSRYPSSDDYGVVKPYRLVHDKGLLFFDYVEGRNASDLLLELGADQQIVVLERIGGWLRRFHDATEPSNGPPDVQERLESLRARLENNCPSSGVFSRLLAYLSHELRKIAKTSFQHVGLHGDCKPENFLFRGMQVIGVDIAWKNRNIAEYDLGQFLAQLALFAHGIWGRRLTGSVKELEEAFLRGYGVGNPDSVRLINWLKGYYYLSYWLSWRKRGHFQRIFWDAYFALFLRGFLKDLNEGS